MKIKLKAWMNAVILFLIIMTIQTSITSYCLENICSIELGNGGTLIIGSSSGYGLYYELGFTTIPNIISSLIIVGIFYLIRRIVRYFKGIINRNIKKTDV